MYAVVPRYTSSNRLSNVREIVSVRIIVPDMNETPSITARAVSAKRSLWASSPLIVTRRTVLLADVFHVVDDGLGRRALELVDDFPVGEEDDAIGIAGGDGIVGDHHDRLAQIGDGLAHELEDLRARLRVEVAGRLVGEDDLRSACESARDGDALLLPTRKLGRPVLQAVGKANRADHTVEPLLVGFLPGERERQRDVLDRRERRDQVVRLEDEPDLVPADDRQLLLGARGDLDVAQQDATRRDAVAPGETVQQRRLARARPAQAPPVGSRGAPARTRLYAPHG